MKELRNLLSIDKEVYFNGKVDELKERLKNLKGVNYKFLNDREIGFSPGISWGILIVSDGAGLIDGINVRAFISDIKVNRLKMNLKTTGRPEHYLIAAVFASFLIMSFFNDHSIWLTLSVVGLWVLCHIWFQVIYRLQENKLIDKVVAKLNLSTE